MSWFHRQPIAHRGLHDERRPENSLAAFDAAADAGYPIELDVHASADGEVVVFHDDTLDRLTQASGRIAKLPFSQLRSLRIDGSAETIPSLREVLSVVADRVPVVIELKNRNGPGVLELRVAKLLDEVPGRYAVQSFNPRSLIWFRRHGEHWPRGMLASDFAGEPLSATKKLLLRTLALAPAVGPAYIGYALDCLPHWAPSCARRLGLPLIAWTVHNDAELQRARRLADNVIFESILP